MQARIAIAIALFLLAGCQAPTPFEPDFQVRAATDAPSLPPQVTPYPASPYREIVGDRQDWSDSFVISAPGGAPSTLDGISVTLTDDQGRTLETRDLTGSALSDFLGGVDPTVQPDAPLYLGDFDYDQPLATGIGPAQYRFHFAGSAGPLEATATVQSRAFAQLASFRLPFSGFWLLAAGHGPDSPLSDEPGMRFGWEFTQADAWGRPYRTDGKQNADYYCYGQPVLAPAAGVVVLVLDEQPDNLPGQLTPGVYPGGNYIVLKHNSQEFSFFLHLKPGSLQVQAGQWVQPGQPLAAVGNSGISYQPRLHLHVQDNAQLYNGTGLPVRFSRVLVRQPGGVIRREALYSPLEHEWVEPGQTVATP